MIVLHPHDPCPDSWGTFHAWLFPSTYPSPSSWSLPCYYYSLIVFLIIIIIIIIIIITIIITIIIIIIIIIIMF